MIVKDSISSLEKVADIVKKIIVEIIPAFTEEFKCDDDPAEYIYLYLHIASFLNARISFLLQEYSKIYDIKMDADSAYKIIDGFSKIYIDTYKRKENVTDN